VTTTFSGFFLNSISVFVMLCCVHLGSLPARSCANDKNNPRSAVKDRPELAAPPPPPYGPLVVSAEDGVKAYTKMREKKRGTVEHYIASGLPCQLAVPEGCVWPNELTIVAAYSAPPIEKFEGFPPDVKFVARFSAIVEKKGAQTFSCKAREVDFHGMVGDPTDTTYTMMDAASPGESKSAVLQSSFSKVNWVQFSDGGLESQGDILTETGPMGATDTSGGRALIRVFFVRGVQRDLETEVLYVVRPKKQLTALTTLPQMTIPSKYYEGSQTTAAPPGGSPPTATATPLPPAYCAPLGRM